MNSFNPTVELENIYAEYKSFFPFCDLINKKENCYLHIETKENTELKISVSTFGWYQLMDVTNRSRYRETFESLMMTLSPGFMDRFNSELTNKLNAHLRQT
ncbi:hypothetical protein G9P44_004453 [Scheffersomyces stipitis]|nr:hypothetical protein G9P44_004453 [Scheffersomyces stipitis]